MAHVSTPMRSSYWIMQDTDSIGSIGWTFGRIWRNIISCDVDNWRRLSQYRSCYATEWKSDYHCWWKTVCTHWIWSRIDLRWSSRRIIPPDIRMKRKQSPTMATERQVLLLPLPLLQWLCYHLLLGRWNTKMQRPRKRWWRRGWRDSREQQTGRWDCRRALNNVTGENVTLVTFLSE